jgi:hypothetical protein
VITPDPVIHFKKLSEKFTNHIKELAESTDVVRMSQETLQVDRQIHVIPDPIFRFYRAAVSASGGCIA